MAEVSIEQTGVVQQHLGDGGLTGRQGTGCGETVPLAPMIRRESLPPRSYRLVSQL